MPAERLPPGPNLPGPVQGLLLVATPRFVRSCQRRYGDRFTIRMGRFGTIVYLADPEDIRAVFRADDGDLHAGEANAPILAPVLGPSSVLVTDEELHRRQRRRLSGPFHGDAVARLIPSMADVAASEVDTWPVGEEFAVLPRMRAVTLEVILRSVIGISEDSRSRLEEMRAALSALVDISLMTMAQFAFPPLARYWPWRELGRRQRRADDLIYREIDFVASDPGLAERGDVLAALVRHREEDGSAMPAVEVRDQLVTLLLAGHETTATGLAWTFERLVRNPPVLAAASAAARNGDDAYLDAVVTESLRVRPVVPDVSRRVCRTFEVGPWEVPPGVHLNPAIALVHRSAERYPDPERFDPSRFAGRRPDPLLWMPFGGGSRRCIGAAFAATEMRVVLREVLCRVDLATTTAADERPRTRHVTLAPHKGGRIRVAARV